MKKCPKCSAENPNDSKFCNSCGASLEGVEACPSTANDFLKKARTILNDSARKVKEAAETGTEKAKQAVTEGKKKVESMSQSHESSGDPSSIRMADQPGGSWDSAAQDASQQDSSWEKPVNQDGARLTVEKYPFFQSEDETAVAVIGEQFAAADLEGTYQAPYAVLTQEKLYIKNEAGHFIKKTSAIETLQIGYQSEKDRIIALALTCIEATIFFSAIGGPVFGLFMGAICLATTYFALQASKKRSNIKLQPPPNIKVLLIFLIIGAVIIFITFSKLLSVLALAFGLLSAKYLHQYFQSPKIFSICCSDGTFSFLLDKYPQQEIANFIDKALPFCQKGKYSSYQANTRQKSSGNGKGAVIVVLILIALLLVGGGIWYFETHCKVFGCGRAPTIDGYCKYHYAEKHVSDAYNEAEDFFNGMFGG